MKNLVLAAVLLAAQPAFAADVPTVALTQDQIQRLIQAESAKAVATYVSQSEAIKANAKDAYEAVQKAFAPKPEAAK